MKISRLSAALACSFALTVPAAMAAQPNILIIFPDDVGLSNLSAYGQGVMGYRTPNIGRSSEKARLHNRAIW
ncbi:hypothetical protein [Shewanella sp. FJAT-52076]|uniref:hypothetical protein n=1 Tax=Shewanella sp. FJAT-52076 TaxID=2864202 RepID=UPI0021AD3531|nr:hypothetical protein [Shewanella sp. FJAT-52076]